MILPVIIAGGGGLRLWPFSTPEKPKPFLALTEGGPTLLQATLLRLKYIENIGPPLVVSGAAFGGHIQSQAALVEHPDISMLLEPEPRNTAAAVCAAALWVENRLGPETILLVLPADHVVKDEDAFGKAIESGKALAAQGLLVTFAVPPTGAATEYGYIKLGRRLHSVARHYAVEAFVEKPSLDRAQGFLTEGGYVWNSGMFMFTAKSLLESFGKHCPNILHACRNATSGSKGTGITFLNEAFLQSPSVSFDVAIMEISDNVACVATDMGWSDVGCWNSVWKETEQDVFGNVTQGRVHVHECKSSIVRSSGPQVLTLGLVDMIVVASETAVLVAPRDFSQQVKNVVEDHLSESSSCTYPKSHRLECWRK